jgi:ubiquinone/menaquinone biosynthesis C-methylase UbiE
MFGVKQYIISFLFFLRSSLVRLLTLAFNLFWECILMDESRKYFLAGSPEEVGRLEAQAKALEEVLENELRILDLKPNMKVLDAGCGTGAFTRKMALKVFPEQACGIDIDPIFVTEASKLAANEHIANVRFELGNIDNLKHESGAFDLSFCRLVLMHVKNPVRTVAELKRVTKKGGIVAASDTDDGGLITFPETPKFSALWAKYGQRAKRRGENRYIGRQLYSIFSEAGLTSVQIYPLPVYSTNQTPETLKMLISVRVQIIQSDIDAMIRESITTKEDYEDALKEISQMPSHPGALIMGLFFLAMGKVS